MRYSQAQLESSLSLTGIDSDVLRREADRLRYHVHGDIVYLRGIIEFSNFCRNRCLYCGINCDNKSVPRYRMHTDEIIAAASCARKWNCTTVVLQSGDDPGLDIKTFAKTIRDIKDLGVAVTLSIGVRTFDELELFRESGADRYLLRFETSETELFSRIHPDESFEKRIECLENLRHLGYQVGTGFMIGLPGWTYASIAKDILFVTSLHPDMIGCGPFLAHPDTALAGQGIVAEKSLYYNAMALVRILNPYAMMPATTAFDALEPGGRDKLLSSGSNVFMPNITPRKYKDMYRLYPGKPGVDEDADEAASGVTSRIEALGRMIGSGYGDAPKHS